MSFFGVTLKPVPLPGTPDPANITPTNETTHATTQETQDKTKKSSSFLGSVNYVTTTVIKKIGEVATNPSAVKKVLQITTKSVAAFDLMTHEDGFQGGGSFGGPATEAMKGTIQVIGFYSIYKDLVFWINPFSKETLDRKALLQSFSTAMANSAGNSAAEVSQRAAVVQGVFDEVMRTDAFYSRDEVREALRNKLLDRHIEIVKVDEIVQGITIKQKERPLALIVASIFFTIVDVLDNAVTLDKWGILSLSKIAAELGKFPVLGFVMKVGIDTAIGIFASAALLVTFGNATYRAYKNAKKIYQNTDADPAKMEKAYKKFRAAIIDMVSNFTDLIATSVPLIFSRNPAVLIAFALISKGTGLVCILIK